MSAEHVAVAIGPIKFAGIATGRLVAPTAYYNPVGEGSLATWIGDPSNDWFYISLFTAFIMACSTLWLLHGAVSFCKTNTITFGLALVIALGIGLLLMEGGKYQPLVLDQSLFAAMVLIAYLSTAGRLFAQKDDKEGKKDK